MFIREKPNKSGSFSIQIIMKSKGQYKVVESIGVARTSEEKFLLKQRALARLNELTKQEKLPLFTERDRKILEYLKLSTRPQTRNVGPELILGKMFDKIGLNKIKEDMFRHITISRLVYPVSKLKTTEYLLKHHDIDFKISSVYRFLDRFYKEHKDDVNKIIYEHSKEVLGEIKIVFYDMTTLYFESEDEDDLRKIGFSKDGKFRNPQIMLGLLLGENGYPIGYDVFEGNKFEGHTLVPVIKKIEKKYKLPKPIIVADSGLLSKDNINNLVKEGYEYIIGARIKNETKDIQTKILNKSQNLEDGKLSFIRKDDGSKLIIGYSVRRSKKDKYNREKGISRLENDVSSGKLTKQKINNRGYNKFLYIKNKIEVDIDREKIKEDERWDGLKGYITNCRMSSKDIVSYYNELWKIEKAFRISKTDLRIRPIYHRKKERIEAHLCIAFAAYAVFKELERSLKINGINISPAKAIELSKTILKITFTLPDSKEKIEIFNQNDNLQNLLINMK